MILLSPPLKPQGRGSWFPVDGSRVPLTKTPRKHQRWRELAMAHPAAALAQAEGLPVGQEMHVRVHSRGTCIHRRPCHITSFLRSQLLVPREVLFFKR